MAVQEREFVDDAEFDIIEFLGVLWEHKWFIVLLSVLLAAAMFVKTEYFTSDTYTSSGILYVSNKRDLSQQDNAIQKSDIESSRTLSTTYIEILKTRAFLTEVSNQIGGNYSWNQIANMLSISSMNETELLRISVRAHNAEDAYLIAKEIVNNAPEKLISVYKSGEVEVVDPPVRPEQANDKGLLKNIVLGAAAGMALGCIYVFLRCQFDTKIHKSEEIEKRYNVSILGEISQ